MATTENHRHPRPRGKTGPRQAASIKLLTYHHSPTQAKRSDVEHGIVFRVYDAEARSLATGSAVAGHVIET